MKEFILAWLGIGLLASLVWIGQSILAIIVSVSLSVWIGHNANMEEIKCKK